MWNGNYVLIIAQNKVVFSKKNQYIGHTPIHDSNPQFDTHLHEHFLV